MDENQKDHHKYRHINVVEKCSEKVLKDLLHYECLTDTAIDNIDKSLIQKYVVGDLDFLQLSISSRNKNFLDIISIVHSVVYKFYSQHDKNEGFAWFSLLLISLSSATPTLLNINAEILSAIDNLISMAKISKARSIPFLSREICLNQIQNSLSNLSEVSKGICQELAGIVLEASCPQDSDVSPEYMMFRQQLTLFAGKYLENASTPPFFILYSDQEGTLVQIKLIDEVNTKLNILYLDAFNCYLESVMNELGGRLASLHQNPQNLDYHNQEYDEQIVSERNTLLYFSELGKTISSKDSDGMEHILLTIGNRHLNCQDYLVEYRVRYSLLNGFHLLNQKLLHQYKSTGCTTLTKKRKLANFTTDNRNDNMNVTSEEILDNIAMEESPVSLLKIKEEKGLEISTERDGTVTPELTTSTNSGNNNNNSTVVVAQKGKTFSATKRKAMDMNGIMIAKLPHSDIFTITDLDLSNYLTVGSHASLSSKRKNIPHVGDIVTHINEIDVTKYENSVVLEMLCSTLVHSLSFYLAKEWIRLGESSPKILDNTNDVTVHSKPSTRDDSFSINSNSITAKHPTPKTSGSSSSKSNNAVKKQQPSLLTTSSGSLSRPTPLPPTLTWGDLKRYYGWYCIEGVGLINYFYIKPSSTGKKMKKVDILRNCKLGVDYFSTEQDAVHAFLKENNSSSSH